jgi:hypothetical protein
MGRDVVQQQAASVTTGSSSSKAVHQHAAAAAAAGSWRSCAGGLHFGLDSAAMLETTYPGFIADMVLAALPVSRWCVGRKHDEQSAWSCTQLRAHIRAGLLVEALAG